MLEAAKSNYRLSKKEDQGIRYSDLCFQAQQSVEKALKGLLIYFKTEPKHTHNIETLIFDLKKHIHIPEDIMETAGLTLYASNTRYPGIYVDQYKDVTKKEYVETIKTTEKCLDWVDNIIKLHLATLKKEKK
jgi:HEPN domain-containing protein